MAVFETLIFVILLNLAACFEIDKNGYVAYCPCMGRFGNQADHFLGSLRFTHELNRTLILPPWIEYRTGASGSIQVPFDTYFKVAPLERYHRVLTMEDFMKNLAPEIWPPEKRIAFCYMARGAGGSDSKECSAKEGNPFGPFWDNFKVDFVGSVIYEPLHTDLRDDSMINEWNKRYPPSEYPVLAFVGAPASFPVQERDIELQGYLEWSDKLRKQVDDYRKYTLPNGPYVGIHLRHGQDWVRACEHVKTSPLLFSAPQCLGYRAEKGKLTQEICLPSKETILDQIKRAVKKTGAKAVFVASDSDHMIGLIGKAVKKLKAKAFALPRPEPHLDLAILEYSHHFIGNCVSSFTAFVKRARDVHGLPSSFWGVKELQDSTRHEEL